MTRRATGALAALAVVAAMTSSTPARGEESALRVLQQRAPAIAERLDPASRAILARVPIDQLEALGSGSATAGEILLADGRTLTEFATAVFGGSGLAIPFFSIDAGGGPSAAGALTLTGSIGQPDAAVSENVSASLLLVGGFRGRGALAPGVLFRDNFETGGAGRWDVRMPPQP